MRLLVLCALGLVAAALAGAERSEATFPGPNGKVVFVRYLPPCSYDADGGFGCSSSIWTANPDRTGLKRLTPGTGVGSPVWSPDGRRIAFFDGNPWARAGIYVVNANGSGLQKVGGKGMSAGDTFGWSPDGKRIIFARTLIRDGKSVGGAIQSIAVDGGDERIHVKTSSPTGRFSGPQLSPDGRRIAYMASRNGRLHLYVARLDGSARRWIANIYLAGEGRAFDWSPDGRRLAYIAPDRETVMDIWIASADGSGRRRLTRNEYYNDYWKRMEPGAWNLSNPAWSPDGNTILFKRSDMSVEVPPAELAFVPAGGGEIRGVLFGARCTIRTEDGNEQCAVWEPAWGRRPAG